MQPKYKIGDTVWRVTERGCVKGVVSGIQSCMGYGENSAFQYSTAQLSGIPALYLAGTGINHRYFPESDFFPSKAALLEHLAM